MTKRLHSIEPGFVVDLLKDNGDGTAQVVLVDIAEWEHWVEPGTKFTITLSGWSEQPQRSRSTRLVEPRPCETARQRHRRAYRHFSSFVHLPLSRRVDAEGQEGRQTR